MLRTKYLNPYLAQFSKWLNQKIQKDYIGAANLRPKRSPSLAEHAVPMSSSTIPDPTTQLETPTSFLTLPAELRNIICSYALSHPYPVLASLIEIPAPNPVLVPKLYLRDQSIQDQTGRHSQGSQPEANQLRYVCRQLYQETHGLSLHYNDIVFWHSDVAAALPTCSIFFSLVSLHHQKRMQKAIIIEALRYEGSIFLPELRWQQLGQTLTGALYPSLYRFCVINRTATLILRMDTYSLADIAASRNIARICFDGHRALRLLLRGPESLRHEYVNDRVRLRILRDMLALVMWPRGDMSEVLSRSPLLVNFRVTLTRGFGPLVWSLAMVYNHALLEEYENEFERGY